MKLLIVGNGGREHAIGWALAKDARVKELFFAPGNAGTTALGTNLDIQATAIEELVHWAEQEKPDLVVVGPEAPLCAGLVDALENKGIPAFGPNQAGAQLEGSKNFTKQLLLKANIPTAQSETFSSSEKARAYLKNQSFPLVIKADGLAAGKGVIIAQNIEEAEAAISDIMDKKVFGDSGNEVLIEEFLTGQEASIHAVTDGSHYVLMPSSQDHKRIFDNDEGPNTGGMGAYSPAPLVTPEILEKVETSVIQPLIKALQAEGINYKGVLYAGLMIDSGNPKVLEFNCRFGDPETQVLLPLLDTPLLDIIQATLDNTIETLAAQSYRVKPQSALTVVLSSAGYPQNPRKGDTITGLPDRDPEAGAVFHAGTQYKDNQVVTAGGRVLAVTGLGNTLPEAKKQAYQILDSIHFDGAHYRKDIGNKALQS